MVKRVTTERGTEALKHVCGPFTGLFHTGRHSGTMAGRGQVRREVGKVIRGGVRHAFPGGGDKWALSFASELATSYIITLLP